MGLGRTATAGAGGCAMGGASTQAAAASQPQRFLLRARPDRWKTPARKTIGEERDLGERDWRRRTSGVESESGPHPRRIADLPRCRGCDQLVLYFLQSANRALLRADAREVRHLHQAPRR